MPETVIVVLIVFVLLGIALVFAGKDPFLCPQRGCYSQGKLISEYVADGPFYNRTTTYECSTHGEYRVVERTDEEGRIQVIPYDPYIT